MARNPAHVTVIQFAPGYLAFTRAQQADDGFSGETSGIEYGQWDAADGSLARALADFVRRNGLGGDRLYLVIPRHEAAARIVELPSQDPDEIRGMVHLSAEEIVPVPLSELLTAHCTLETLPGGASRVLAVVVRKTVVESALAVVAAAGLRIEQVLLSTACLMTALRRSELAPVAAALHVSPDGFEAAVLRDNALVFSRGVVQSVATAPGDPSPESIEELIAEFRASLATYRRDSRDGAAAAEIVLSATGIDTEKLTRALHDAFGAPVRRIGDLVAQGTLHAIGGDRAYHISLMPEAELNRRAAAGTRTRLVRYAIAAGIAAVAALALYAQMIAQRGAYLRELDQRAEELRPTARTLLAKRKQLQIIDQTVDRSLSPLRILAQFADTAPDKGVNFSRFTFDRSDGLVLSGSATDPALFDNLIDNIRATSADTFPQFARAREMYRTARAERGRQVWDFAVTIPFDAAEGQ
jgi:Tfp pilus assembly PilM family ATPase